MNYCPHCGKPLRGGGFSFCEGCTEKTFAEQEEAADKSLRHTKGKKQKKIKGKAKAHPDRQGFTMPGNKQREDYDGYYDDVRPEDGDEVRQGIDKYIMKRIAGIVAGVMIIICCCVAVMYLI